VTRVGIVAIGRNEGERLRRCLTSLATNASACPVVYVDSGSTDGSREVAAEAGAMVVDLDLSTPFTAARARNEGADRLLAAHPETVFIQFIDGDCELQPGWVDAALEAITGDRVAIVCGRRRERHPDASIYNRLIDLEWNTPIGEAAACGGDSLIRTFAFQQAGGFDRTVIAGEEPELCLRLRRAKWCILRIDHEMAFHDAAITRFSQWWMRAVRSGYAYAEGAWRYGRGSEHYNVRNIASILVWSVGFPVVGLAATMALWFVLGPLAALVAIGLTVGAYIAQFVKLTVRGVRRDFGGRIAMAWSASVIIGKFAELVGVLTFARRRILGTDARLIEYKRSASSPSAV